MGKLQLKIDGNDFTGVLADNPVIKDQLNACCRTLTFKLSLYGNRLDLLAHKVELFYSGKRWFIGEIKKQKEEHDGTNSITAYDPLFLFGKHEDDYYFKNQTATQIVKSMAKKIGLKVYKLENTKVVISYVLYKKGAPDKITVDVLARTWKGGGDKFWFRYDPINDGILLKRRTVRGLTRIEATANKRVLSIVADPGVRIPQGYTFTSVVTDEEGNPIEFTADRETIFLSDKAVDVRITCTLTGNEGNLATGSEFILQPPIAGVTSITDTGTVVMAAERESLDAAWTRILDKAENPDTGGNVHDYERWVVDGFYKDYGVKVGKVLVDMCWNKDNGHDGRGTVRVVVVDDTYGPLDTSIVNDIKEYLDPKAYEGYGYGKAPGGAVVTVIKLFYQTVPLWHLVQLVRLKLTL